MAGIRTKRWNDPVSRDDGTRILITRYRPRGLRKDQENWESWAKQLAPSKELHAAAYGKDQEPISWDEYRTRYLTEVANHRATISDLAQRVRNGETVTLLCASSCEDPNRCHRSILKELIEAELPKELHSPAEARPADVIPPQYSKLKDWLG